MTRLRLLTSLGLALLSLASLLAGVVATAHAEPGPAEATLRRFALVASSNDGGRGRSRLRFADSDADAIARVLGSLGGVSQSDIIVVRDASRPKFRAAFDALKSAIVAARRPSVRHELFVYYSGHSDEAGLLLGEERVGYRELRSWIDEAHAEVKIAVLDSCASGSLIRLKGGKHRPSFLSDVSSQVRGHAFLTASSDDEAAQESDRIGAAYFTHFLVSGLRGAADANRDRRVTLHEAYDFARQETLSRTEISQAGPQHPSFDFQLAGTGDLVMTDLRATRARLVLDDELAGRVYVRDAAGRLLAELRKEPLYPVELGLEPGRYRVVLDADGRPFEAHVQLAEGGRADLGRTAFTALAPTLAVARGTGPATDLPADASVTAPSAQGAQVKRYRNVPVDFIAWPGVRLSGASSEPIRHQLALGIVADSNVVDGLQLSLIGNIARDELQGLQLSPVFNMVSGNARGAQLASTANATFGAMKGIQLSGFVNLAGELDGAQIGVVNLTRRGFQGAQLSAFNAARADGQGRRLASPTMCAAA